MQVPADSIPRRVGLVVAAAGLLLLVASVLVARNGRVGSAEESVFRTINELPKWLYRPLWVFQQLGNVVVAFLVVLAVAAVLRNRRWPWRRCSASWPNWPWSAP